MARQNHGPLSRAKGKLGGVVYQQYEGMQIAREYQPVVKNPQSESQTINRAGFKLASQTVGIFREVINARLSKASIYARKRRGIAVEAIKRIISSEDTSVAVENFSNVISAINAKAMTEYGAPTVSFSGSSFDVTAPADTEILGVIAGFDADGNYIGRKVVGGAGTASARPFSIPSDFAQAKAMFLYSVPTTEEGRATYANIVDPAAELQVAITRLVSAGAAGISDLAEGIYTRV